MPLKWKSLEIDLSHSSIATAFAAAEWIAAEAYVREKKIDGGNEGESGGICGLGGPYARN